MSSELLVKNETPLGIYISYLHDLGQMVPEAIRKNERNILQIEKQLSKSLIESKTGSEIIHAVVLAAAKRKIAYNGGKQDDGSDKKFRLGQAAVCYLRWAHSENLIQRNPYPKNTFKRPPQNNPYCLPPEKMMFLYRYEKFELIDKAIIRFLSDTGVRVSELCRVKISDINFDKNFVRVYMTKVNRLKEVPLTDFTKKTLFKMLSVRKDKKFEYLFQSQKNRTFTIQAIALRLRNIGQQFGFRMNPHSFRHASTTLMYKKFGEVAAAKFAGHVDMRSTARYVHITGEEFNKMQNQIRTEVKNMAGVFSPAELN